MIRKTLCLATILGFATAGHAGERWTVDFGHTEGWFMSSNQFSTTFIPGPAPSNGGTAQFYVAEYTAGMEEGGGGFYTSLVNGEMQLYIRGPRGERPSKFSVLEIPGSPLFQAAWRMRFVSTDERATYTFHAGDGASFANDRTVHPTDAIMGLRWSHTQGQTKPDLLLLSGSEWIAAPAALRDSFTMATYHDLHLYAVNAPLVVTYERNGETYQITGPAWDIWVDGTRHTVTEMGSYPRNYPMRAINFTSTNAPLVRSSYWIDDLEYANHVGENDPPVPGIDEIEAWGSDRTHRLVIRVPASPMLDERDVDERPATLDVDLMDLMASHNIDGRPDLTTLQLVEINPETGRHVSYDDNAIQETPADRPVRWYDGSIPFNYPDFDRSIASTGGEFTFVYRDRWGYFFDTVGEWEDGKIGWVHTQRRDEPTYYAAYFNLMEADDIPSGPPPRGFIGDGIHRAEEVGPTTTAQLQTRITLDDFNGNGLVDIIAGCHRGQMTWWPNLGTPEEPKFAYSKMIFMEDGKPLDVGRHGSPHIVDWDGDGVKDLLVSSINFGRMNFFKNVGTNEDRVFSYRGFLKADGEYIESPYRPVPEADHPETGEPVFKNDYYSQPFAVDWNGNGLTDLVTGGYVTGRIYLYRNTGELDEDGLPVLTFEGPIMADGEPLDVGWSASPVVVDINNNGKLDIISGLWMNPGHGGVIHQPGERFLRLFENIGTRTEPELTLRPMPKTGNFPTVALSTPDVWDFTNNGVLDLIVSANLDIWLFENTGTPEEPNFAAHNSPIKVKWGSASFPIAARFSDVNGNGLPDMMEGYHYYLNQGTGYPFRFGARTSLLPPGMVIDHPVEQGDGWAFRLIADFNSNDLPDAMFGDFWGQVWFHENIGSEGAYDFDTEGVLVRDTTGEPIQVGPDFDEDDWDFVTLQGSRIMFATADYTGNGLLDIVTRDTLGNITFFERTGSADEVIVKPGVVIATGMVSGYVYDIDWDGDGRPDVYIPSSLEADTILLNTEGPDGSIEWTETEFVRPGIPVQGTITAVQPVDLNGDGDLDIIITNGYRFTSLFERTFLDLGYAEGELIRLETKPVPPRHVSGTAVY